MCTSVKMLGSQEEKGVGRVEAAFSKLWSLVVCSGVSLDIGGLMGVWPGLRVSFRGNR